MKKPPVEIDVDPQPDSFTSMMMANDTSRNPVGGLLAFKALVRGAVLLAVFCGLSVTGKAALSVSISPVFRDLDPGMPSSFQLGQTVEMRFDFEEPGEGLASGGDTVFADVIRSLSVGIPETGFAFEAAATGDVTLQDDGLLAFSAKPVAPFTFESLVFERAALWMAVPTGFATGGSWDRLDELAYHSFRLHFRDSSTGRGSSGVTSVIYVYIPPPSANIPEPSTSAAVLALAAAVLVVRRRFRRFVGSPGD